MLLTSHTLNHISCCIKCLSLPTFCCWNVAGWPQATRSSLLYRHPNATWRSGTDTVRRVIGLGVQSVWGTPWLSSSTCAANMVSVIDILVAEPGLFFFAYMWPCCIVTNFFTIKPTRCTNFTNLFWHETLHVSDCSSVHHQEFIHCTLSNGICHTGL